MCRESRQHACAGFEPLARCGAEIIQARSFSFIGRSHTIQRNQRLLVQLDQQRLHMFIFDIEDLYSLAISVK
jgi:hypothetical protein